MPDTKTCGVCRELKPLTDFYRHNKRGRQGRCKPCQVKYNHFRRYNLDPDEFEAMVKKQNGICPLCLLRPSRLVIDHNHKTGKKRGLLCDRCNRAIEAIASDIGWLRRAVLYLKGEL